MFIKLTKQDSRREVFVNVDKIEAFYADGAGTLVVLNECEGRYICVEESPDDIVRMLNGQA